MTIYTYTMLYAKYPHTADKVFDMLDKQIDIYHYEWLPNLYIIKAFKRILAQVLCEQVSECGKTLSPELVHEQALITADNIILAAGYYNNISDEKRTMIIRSYLMGISNQYTSINEL